MPNLRRLATLGLVVVVAVVVGACTTPASQGGEGCTGVTCSGHGICVLTAGVAACQCESGYAPSGLQCVVSTGCDPNPCTQPHQTRCEIQLHRVVCSCDFGWHETGAGCVADEGNPCFPNPCTETNKTQCALENGVPRCKCDAGFAEDENGACTVTDPCNPNPCSALHKGQCSNEGGAAKCGCDAGYVEDQGGNCVAGDHCNPNPCTTAHKTVCTLVAGQAYCSCDAGYKADGQGGCVLQPACDPNPCTELHKTVCTELVGGGYKCGCDPLYVDDGSGTCIEAPDPTCAAAHPNGDAYENDDCAQYAEELPVGATQSRTIDIAGDVDWMKSTLLAGHTYHFECTGQDLKVYLYDTDATTQLLYKDDPETLDFQPTVDGTYYWKAQHYYSTYTGAYTAKLTEVVDDHGNSATYATALTTLGTAVNGTIDYAGDYDWFKFDGSSGHLYEANTTGADTYVYFYDTNGTTIISQSDYPPIYLTATATATYYVAVRHYSSSSTGAYTLTVTDLGVENSGDNAATAGVITPGTPVGAMISPAGDNDWYKFDAVAGHSYKVDTTGVDTYVYLYATDGTTILSESDYPPLYLTAAGVGPYYVRVRHYSSSSTGMYTLTVTDLGPDDHGDDAAHATLLPVGATGLTGAIIPAGDNDWFKFDAVANHAYKVTTTGITTYVYLYDPNGTTILKESSTVPVYVYLTTAGTYYIRVKHSSTTGVGQYTVKVEDVGVDDHGNDAAHATLAFTSGTGVDGVINYPGDDDWFKFDATANHLYSINTTYRSPSTYFDSYVYIYDTNGTTIIKESDPVPVVFGASVAGTYYVRVRHYYSTSTDYYYTLTITDVGTDDCGSGTSTTCVIVPGAPPGTPVPGRIEVGGDDDWFAFDAAAGHIYKCTTTGIDTYVYLIDTDGTTALKSQDDPLIYFSAPQSGRYYYKVRAYYSTTAGDYSVTCTDEGIDDYPNGPVGAPVVPTDGTVQNGAIQYPADADWFAFVAEASSTYKIDNPPVAGADTVVELYNTDGATLIVSADTPPTITRQLGTAGTYYVKVRLYSSTATGAYTLAVTKQ
ncbi:MAG: PPC domain-containing protein [Deltaproteobacteria bacterium]|nr:PPC domain-containing protein [Deltaproteobacteria bacterium]